MFVIKRLENKKGLKWLLIGATIFCVLFYVFLTTWLYFESVYQNRIYPGVRIGALDLSGKTEDEARKMISERVNELYFDGIYFEYRDKKAKLDPIISSASGEWAYQVIDFDIEASALTAFNYGRSGNFIIDLKNKIKHYFTGKEIEAGFEINQAYFENFLSENFGEFEMPAQNARLNASRNENEEITFEIEKEKMGVVLDSQKARENLKAELARLNSTSITLSTISSYPEIHQSDCLNIAPMAKNILSLSPYYIESENKKWTLSEDIILAWLALEKNQNDKVIASLNQEKIKEYLQDEIADKIDIEPIDARFEVKNGRVTEFQASRDGYQVDIASSTNKIIDDFIFQKATSSQLIFNITKSSLKTGEANDFGIQEIIGTGHSNFAGSPANRRHNIRVGANAMRGIIIKPEEEFSLVKNLGPVDASAGYLPELVIKDNKTIPEYGGGLCQIATTLFRSAVQSGLTITERRNHSYRVSYYEPAGTDAAVYIPHPDVRFVNDTKNNILIQYRIEGNDLYFDFWGTKDGREIEVSAPVIYNIVRPAPTRIIETTDLKPGEKKCTEKAHNGADAYFDYKVTYADGEIKERRFTSHYVPWQEVCLLGVEESENEESDDKPEESETQKDEVEETQNENENSSLEKDLTEE